MQRSVVLTKHLTLHFLLIILANAPFWIIGFYIFVNRPLITHETILALVVCTFSRSLGAIVFLIAWLIDVLVSQSFTYQFLAPIDFLQSARFGGDLDWFNFFSLWHLVGAILFLGFLYPCLKFAGGISKPRSNSAIYFILIGFLLISLDAVNGASDIWRRDKMLVPVNITGSPGFTLIKASFKSDDKKSIRKIIDDQSILKKFNFVEWASSNPDRSILFIVVESLGIPQSRDALDWLNGRIKIINYKKEFHEIGFKGATTSGELRSLCGLEGSYTSINPTLSSQCLPLQLSRIGWSASGYHGFSSRIFDRQSWWPSVGLNQTFFIESSEVYSLPKCGNVFRGACDKELLNLAIAHAATPKSFHYVLTLNTHLPVVPVQIPPVLFEICAKDELPESVCMHLASLGEIVGYVAEKTSTLSISPLIVVVGDHAPPFSGLRDRNSFKQNVIPGFVLVPRS
jgi:phosphoglycerol transferase MdoB-like AlkP superfamily enzyme